MDGNRNTKHSLLNRVREGNPTVPGRSTARCRTSSPLNRGLRPKNTGLPNPASSSSSDETGMDDKSGGDGLPQVPRFQSDSGKNLRNR